MAPSLDSGSPPDPSAAGAEAAPAAGSAALLPGQRRGRWVAIITGAISVLVGVLYLGLILVLDSRGPLQPPPPEALGLSAPAVPGPAAGAAAGAPVGAAAPPPA